MAEARADYVFECPTPEEIQAYWEQHGMDMKSAGTCGDPDPLPPDDGSGGEEHSHGAEPQLPATAAEAQQMLDPTNDPLVLITKDEAGRFGAVHIAMAPGQKPPPATVRTTEEIAEWVKAQGGN